MNETSPPEFKSSLRLSLFLHGILAGVIVLQSLVFNTQSRFKEMPPVLRVDLVDLPDQLKNETPSQALPAAPPVEEKELPKPKVKSETADPDEMVVKPKKETAKEREKRLKSALNRIKSLDKISSLVESEKPKPSTLIKGNRISKGSSLSADAIESMEASYFDSVRDRLQSNWELPLWLSRQGLNAQVLIFIDSYGKLKGLRFLKSSGNPQFDDAIRATIKGSDPFPVPPQDLLGRISNGIPAGFPL